MILSDCGTGDLLGRTNVRDSALQSVYVKALLLVGDCGGFVLDGVYFIDCSYHPTADLHEFREIDMGA
jgi:hypothetical protein